MLTPKRTNVKMNVRVRQTSPPLNNLPAQHWMTFNVDARPRTNVLNPARRVPYV